MPTGRLRENEVNANEGNLIAAQLAQGPASLAAQRLRPNAGHPAHRARVEVSQNQRLRGIAMARRHPRLAANARGSPRALAANAEKRTAGCPGNSRGMNRLPLERVR